MAIGKEFSQAICHETENNVLVRQNIRHKYNNFTFAFLLYMTHRMASRITLQLIG